MTSSDGPHFDALTSYKGRSGNLTVVDMVLPDMLHLVDEHWLHYAPLDPLWHGILGFSIFVLAAISLCGNGIVIYIFSTTKALRTPSNLLVINLAVSDFLMMFTMAPPMIANGYKETWIFGPLMCQLYGMCGSLFGCVSIWTMTMIAFDRYNVIVKGLSGKPMSTCGALLNILFIWTYSLSWTLAPFFGWNRYVPEGSMSICGTDFLSTDFSSRSYIVLYTIACYFLPMSLIIYSYWFILSSVSAHEKNMREQAKKMNVASLRSAENQNTSAECKLAKVLLVTITLWFIAWTPYGIINLAFVIDVTIVTPLFTIWGALFAKANAVYNPIVYGISHPKYRIALFKRFPWLACTGEQEPTYAVDANSAASGVTVSDEKTAAA